MLSSFFSCLGERRSRRVAATVSSSAISRSISVHTARKSSLSHEFRLSGRCDDAALFALPTHRRRFAALLVYPFSVVSAIAFASAGYASVAFGHPLEESSWWHCMVPCATLWLGLKVAMDTATVHNLILNPDNSDDVKWPFLGWAVLTLFGGGAMAVVWWALWAAFGFYPVFFHGVWSAVTGIATVHLLTMRVLLPREVRLSDSADANEMRRRTVYVIGFLFCWLLIGQILNWGVMIAYEVVREKYGDGAAVVCSLGFFMVRELGCTVCSLIISRGLSKDDTSLLSLGYLMMSVSHASFLAVSLGSSSWQVTLMVSILDMAGNASKLLLLVNEADDGGWAVFIWNRLIKKRPSQMTEEQRLLLREARALKLIANELCEFLVPMCVGTIFTVCSYGKNSNWMGGVGTSVWHYPDVQGASSFLVNVAIMMGADVVVGVITHWAMRHYAYVNMVRVATLLAEYNGSCVVAMLCFTLYHCFCITLVHCGMDFSLSSRQEWEEWGSGVMEDGG